jgi:hypothetical protein
MARDKNENSLAFGQFAAHLQQRQQMAFKFPDFAFRAVCKKFGVL